VPGRLRLERAEGARGYPCRVRVAEHLAPPWADGEERVVETGAFPISIRKRGHWYHLDDRGEAVARARSVGATGDWLGIAEPVVAQEGFNVNRRGVVFVSAVEGRDLASFAERLGECAARVHAALLDND
jgi:hypothetical protein